MFFSTRISHVISELKQRKELREFMGIEEEEVPKESYVYAFLSKFSLNGFDDSQDSECHYEEKGRNQSSHRLM